jgi:hypothetical protein
VHVARARNQPLCDSLATLHLLVRVAEATLPEPEIFH